MHFDDIPAVQLQDLGVSFRYLVLRVKSGQEERTLIRGMNFRPYESGIEQQIVNRAIKELSRYGFQEGRDELAGNGGGTATLNPYYETLTLFGIASGGESEANREEVCELFRQAFPEHEVSWYSPDHAAEMERREQEAKAKAKAAQAAAKAGKAAAEKEAAESQPEPSESEAGSPGTDVAADSE